VKTERGGNRVKHKEAPMVLLASDFDKSRFLKAADLSGEKKFRIKSVTVEEIGTDKKERKPIVWFTNDERGLPLNLTNLRALSGAYGDNMEAWAGKIIVLFPTKTDLRGKLVDALRVRIPPPKQASGNGQTVSTPKPAPTTQASDDLLDGVGPPSAKPSLASDLDDEIPF
jgi:hypothetical protein